MFTRNKKNYRAFIYGAIVITLCLLVIALAWPQDADPNQISGEEEAIVTNEDSSTEEKNKSLEEETEENRNTAESEEEQIVSGDNSNEETNMSEDGESYYLVKRAGDQIVVYFCDASGETVALETTQILYEVLSSEDQKLFDEGIKVHSQEELGVLLQDFES